MKRIIADDFGMTNGINKAILKCYKNKVITRASLMVNQEYTYEAISMIKENNLNVGLHFNLTQGIALTDSSILSKDFFMNADINWIKKELEAQLDILIKNNIDIKHIDMHHNINFRRKDVHELLLSYCEIIRTEDNCVFEFSENQDFLTLVSFLYKDKEEELMVHPAFCDDLLYKLSPTYCEPRKIEFDILLSSKDIITSIL